MGSGVGVDEGDGVFMAGVVLAGRGVGCFSCFDFLPFFDSIMPPLPLLGDFELPPLPLSPDFIADIIIFALPFPFETFCSRRAFNAALFPCYAKERKTLVSAGC